MEKQQKLTGYPSIDQPWLKNYSPEWINRPLSEDTIFESLLANNRDYPNDIAIHYLKTNITYGEMFAQIDQCARAFIALGVQRNDIVTMAMPNTPEMVYTVYALNRLGAIPNIIHPLAGKEEICKYLNEVRSRFFLMFTGTYAIVKDALNQTSVEKAIVASPVESLSPIIKFLYRLKKGKEALAKDERILSWKQFICDGQTLDLPAPQRADEDAAAITHTGGTTGDPKGVVCSNKNYVSKWEQMKLRDCERQDCAMIHLPPFVNYSLSTLFTSFSMGFRTLLIPHYETNKIADYIYYYKVNHILSIPACCEAILHISKIRKDAFQSLKLIAAGGESMDAVTIRDVNKILREYGSTVDLVIGMGMTELTGGVAHTSSGENGQGSIGVPFIKSNCKIVEIGTDIEKTYDEIGEICFSGPTVMIGYYGDKKGTDEIIHVDGNGTRWVHSGDLGYITRDGTICVIGRIKRLIMIKDKDGLISKIFPERIEHVIETHPAVALNCVVGVPDEQCIAWPKAFVVLNENIEANQEVKTAILAHCSQHLPPYMVPREIAFIDEMPRTDRGKIDFKQLEHLSMKFNKI